MSFSADDALFLAEAERAVPPWAHATDMSIPLLMPESAALRRSTAVIDCGEPLVEITGPRIAVLHSYAAAGWRNAVGQQWLRTGVVARLQQAATALPAGFGIAVFDGWRPLSLQRELFHAISPDLAPDGIDLVAAPSEDPAEPPPHLTGGAVDLTLTWQGAPLALGTTFDEFTDVTATTAFEEISGSERKLRRLLYHTLRSQGFTVLAEEWWHFEFGTRLWSGLTRDFPRYGPTSP